MLLQSTLVPPSAAAGRPREQALHAALQSCSLQAESRDAQRLWPVGSLRVAGAELGGTLARGFEADPGPATGPAGVEQTRILKVERIDKVRARALASLPSRDAALPD